MTLAQRVAAEYRTMAKTEARSERHAAELNAIADVVEAGHNCSNTTEEVDHMNQWDTALAKLAKAVGVEGE